MSSSKDISLRIRAALALAMISVLSVAPVASADAVVITGTMEGSLTIKPGDTIQAGYDFDIPGNHAATTITVIGSVVVKVTCPNNQVQTITINFPAGTYPLNANDGNWWPAGNPYQGSAVVPSTFCGGKSGIAYNGATYTGTFSSTANCITANGRFHYSDKSSGTWSYPTSCGGGGTKCISTPCTCK